MKKLISSVLLLSSISALANSPCIEQQINTAAVKMAIDYGVSTKQLKLKGYKAGKWTKVRNVNSGSDFVTLSLTRSEDGVFETYTETYKVSATQLGNSKTCTGVVATNRY
jgi:hypothetical protein